ncbi:hypothetical protein LSS_15066 [Leptospira santarosai serovar Shermani str. LT 821]|uniref:Uncharacterized protein n=1 Tax=Leptospira santarosai serovar Shermani str. LT 821 TaxID=758847 RepID=K8Y5L6_9LEPT|nr:hypothetical protein LSS_15066 [Leptospira santarosai serovar Shermani str. LT 821]
MTQKNQEEIEILLLEIKIQRILNENIRHNPQKVVQILAIEMWRWSRELLNKNIA